MEQQSKNNTKETTKAVMYLRYSSRQQRSVSLDEQRIENLNYCLKHGYECIREYSDAALSGKTDQRPAFQQMIQDAMNKPEFSKIVVYDMTRFSRKPADSEKYRNMLSDRNIYLESATEFFDRSAAGDLHLGVMQSVAKFEVDNMTKRVVRGLKYNASLGEHTGGKPPYGYELVNKKLAVDPREAGAVRQMFEMFDLGYTYAEIAEELYAKGYRSTSEDYRFKKTTINAMLKNEKYVGTYTYNKANSKDSMGRRTKYKKKAPEEIIKVSDGCPAIVSKELFDRVQQKLAKNAAAQKSKSFHMLSSNDLVVCQYCGKKMRATVTKSRNGGTEYRTYVCNNHKDKGCPTKNIQEKYIDDFVLDKLQRLLFSSNMKPHLLRLLNSVEYTTKAEVKDRIRTCQYELNKTKKEHRRLMDIAKNSSYDEALSKEIAQLNYNAKVLEAEIETLKAKKPVKVYTAADIDTVQEIFVEYLKHNDTVTTRMFLQDVVEKVTVGNEEVEAVLKLA